MNNKAFSVSMLLAATAVFMIYSFITSKEEEIKQRYGSELSVVVAKKNIKELDEINENMLEIVNKPKSFIEPGFTKDKKEVIGFIAMVPLAKGEQVTLNKIQPAGVATGLSKLVSMGKRAVSLPVDDNSGVSRLLKPGDRVDLVATIEPPGGARGSNMTKIVAQDLPILAVGEFVSTRAPRKVESDDITGKTVVRNLNVEHNYNTVTVEADPQIAMNIALLRDSNSHVSVMLRNNDDTERLNMPATTLLDILGPDQGRIVRAPGSPK